jgi:hypothetical protein
LLAVLGFDFCAAVLKIAFLRFSKFRPITLLALVGVAAVGARGAPNTGCAILPRREAREMPIRRAGSTPRGERLVVVLVTEKLATRRD